MQSVGGRVLEVGVGTGISLRRILAQQTKLVSIDISEPMLRKAQVRETLN